jgi:hypothetical protein
MRRNLSIIVAACLLTACAGSNYGPAKGRFGYSDTQLSASQFRVRYTGNAVTKADAIEDYSYLHAAELTLEHGFAYFDIRHTNTVVGYYNNLPSSAITVNMYHEVPADKADSVLEAQEIVQRLRGKYELDQ